MHNSSGGAPVDRRTVLRSVGAGGLAALAGCSGGSSGGGGTETDAGQSLGNAPVTGSTVTFGFTVPQTGAYGAEGTDELRGYKLAVEHLNDGGGWADGETFGPLSGGGVLGKTVEYVEGDTQTDSTVAADLARDMVANDDVVMLSGGSSSSVAIAIQEVAQETHVPFMACLTHSNDTTGKDCKRYGFREMFNAYMSVQALQPVLTGEFGYDVSFYQLYADYTWGQTVQSSVEELMGEVGWEQIASEPTRLGTSDYTTQLEAAADSEADVVFLDQYGLDAAKAITQAGEVLPEETAVVVPLYNRLIAQNAAADIEGIYGTIAWDTTIDTPLSNSFFEAFQAKYGDDQYPSGPAQLAYGQTLQFAAAAERAGSFYPPDIIRALEGFEYALGMGQETMRACDHQAIRPVPVVRGLPAEEQSAGQFYELVDVTRDVGYTCQNGPASQCSLGQYGDE